MSECGKCRHWKQCFNGHPEEFKLGICDREDWVFAESLWQIDPQDHGPYTSPKTVMSMHHKHILSSTHPAPPCYEGKRGRVKEYDCRRYRAEDDIKKGEEVEIV